MIKNTRKRRTGKVISNKMNKTIVVKVITTSKHVKYNRVMKHANKFMAHDENDTAKIGDTVLIEETRPISKGKRWRLVEVVEKAQAVDEVLLDEPLSVTEERVKK
ncbi:MAG: 30S ribosomal protein S17 [Candidatus Omnitrophica bacterium]|jgi:small subunit ribosomal protein S17|nr:30S ribosomal protein S17 [Candidatus Omnitrophota bacterium]MDD5654099.1 30S ribosomal protein S17 [Candidatus Omnitrophota bacterium]